MTEVASTGPDKKRWKTKDMYCMSFVLVSVGRSCELDRIQSASLNLAGGVSSQDKLLATPVHLRPEWLLCFKLKEQLK
jgi:hypothetical protein